MHLNYRCCLSSLYFTIALLRHPPHRQKQNKVLTLKTHAQDGEPTPPHNRTTLGKITERGYADPNPNPTSPDMFTQKTKLPTKATCHNHSFSSSLSRHTPSRPRRTTTQPPEHTEKNKKIKNHFTKAPHFLVTKLRVTRSLRACARQGKETLKNSRREQQRSSSRALPFDHPSAPAALRFIALRRSPGAASGS